MAHMMFASFKKISALPLCALVLVPQMALAQSDPDEVMVPGGVMPAGVVMMPQNPADALTFNLNILARNPRDVTALTRAGDSALAVGDANAAVGFLGRAEQLSPSNGHIKKSLGTAMVMLERPMDAMPFFDEAAALGVSEREIARDRGLAWDLRGDPRRAQADYAAALKYGADDEVTRRLALSYGISGDRDRGLKLLEPLIRRQDQAAWRSRAFILAMTGDERGAERIVEQVMPYGMSSTMTPFLRRLAGLSLADRARAVNFGSMPADAMTRVASVDPDASFRAIDGRVGNGLIAPPPPVAVASAEDERFARKHKKDRRRPGGDSDGSLIAAVAPRSTSPSIPAPAQVVRQVQQTAPAPPPIVAGVRRVGQRIGPVNPELLPPEARPAVAGSAPSAIRAVLVPGNSLPPPSGTTAVVAPPAAVRAVLVPGVTALPPPSGAAPLAAPQVALAAPVAKPAETMQKPASTEAVPPPLFELPTKPVAPLTPNPTPAVQTPAPSVMATPPVTPAKEPTLAPAPAPTQVAALTPIKSPVLAPTPAVPSVQGPALTPAPIAATVPAPAPIPTRTGTPVSTPVLTPVPAPTPAPAPLVSVPSTKLEAAVAPTSANSGLSAAVATPPQIEAPSLVTATPAPSKMQGPPAPGFEPTFSSPSASLSAPAPETQTGLAPAPMIITQPAETLTAPVAAVTPPAPETVGLASIIASVETEAETPAAAINVAEIRKAQQKAAAEAKLKADAKAKLEAKAKADLEAKEAAKQAALAAEQEKQKLAAAEKKKNPQRYWVQVATGSNRSGLPGTLKKLREQAPDALKGTSAAAVPYKATNRLLVGPFKSQAEARAKVNELGKQGISASTFTSDQGQEVAKITSK